MERLVAYIENNPVKAGLVVERLERRSRPGLRAEARSGTLKRAPQSRPEMYKLQREAQPRQTRPPHLTFCPLPFAFHSPSTRSHCRLRAEISMASSTCCTLSPSAKSGWNDSGFSSDSRKSASALIKVCS